MEITVQRIDPQGPETERDASDVTHTYRVIDNGREFRIACRTHRHGGSLAIEGEEGVLYTDLEDNTVRRQVIAVGKTCGISLEEDAVVEGLSPWSLRGVIAAERSGERRQITLTAEGPAEGPISAAILVDGRVSDLDRFL